MAFDLQGADEGHVIFGAAREAGFTLIETVAAIAIVAMLVALALPSRPHSTTKPEVQALALRVAAVLKADRNAAIRVQTLVETRVSLPGRKIASGAGGGVVQVPEDVGFDALLTESCGSESAIAFLPNGQSCGASISFARPGAAYHVRVNWLTGGVEIVEVHAR